LSFATELVEDPSQNHYVADRLTSRFHSAIDRTSGTIDANLDNLDLKNQLLNVLAVTMLENLRTYLELSIRRGVFYAVQQMNVNPTISISYNFGERWLSDINLLDDLMDENMEYVANVVEDVRKDDVEQAKTRSEQIARTETMRAFNKSALGRYRAYGVQSYTFIAHLNACNEPKMLPDGTIAEKGCIGLHNTSYPITDTAHVPPIHPNCRCTLIPDFEGKT